MFIDVFEGGGTVTRQEIEDRLMKGDPPIDAREEYFATTSPRDILIRILNNLRLRALEEKDAESMYRYVDTILTLNPDDGDYRAMRFEIGAFTKRLDQARTDADWLLDKTIDHQPMLRRINLGDTAVMPLEA